MKKSIIILIAITTLFVVKMPAQDKYITKNGHVWFYSKTQFKEIEAHNKQVAAILDIKTGELVVNAAIRSFKFDNALVEEHFNENYIESNTFPKAKFKGRIVNIGQIDLTKPGTYEAQVEGEMEMHGCIKKIKETGKAVVKDGKIYATAKFYITADEFKIAIPEIVKDKIAEKIEVNIDFIYEPYTK